MESESLAEITAQWSLGTLAEGEGRKEVQRLEARHPAVQDFLRDDMFLHNVIYIFCFFVWLFKKID